MNIRDYKNIYMIGIGGISMSGIAEILVNWGFKVSGSDMSESAMTEKLRSNGINVNIGQVKENITKDIDLVVYTAAIKSDNPELVEARNLGIETVERGKFLGEITKLFKDVIGVAGTHGKTTTSSMVSSAFMSANLDPSIQIGANLRCIDGNYRVGNSDYFIIEACEYVESLECKNNIILIKTLSNPYSILKKCDYFVLSSFYEGFGIVIAEADILKKPVISTDILGPRKFIKDNGSCLVENSEKGLESGIQRLLNNEIKVMNVDYEKYNQEALEEFYDLINN